jgi:hypothetical protein
VRPSQTRPPHAAPAARIIFESGRFIDESGRFIIRLGGTHVTLFPANAQVRKNPTPATLEKWINHPTLG